MPTSSPPTGSSASSRMPSRCTNRSRQPATAAPSQTTSQPSGDGGSGSTSLTFARVQNWYRGLNSLSLIHRIGEPPPPAADHSYARTMATFVLVHGAWHGGCAWERRRTELAAARHESIVMDLTVEDPAASFEDYASVVVDAASAAGSSEQV